MMDKLTYKYEYRVQEPIPILDHLFIDLFGLVGVVLPNTWIKVKYRRSLRTVFYW